MKQEYNAELFKNKDLWANYGLSENVQFRISFIADKIPKNVKSILDVGCGNGIMTNILNKNFEQVIGVDNSAEALESVEGKSILSNCDNIKVDDHSFDLVLSSEMIEHLPDDVLTRTIQEFERISKRYILVSVPNNELLEARHIYCPKCKSSFHSVGHLQSFNGGKLRSLFSSDFKVLDEGEFGGKQLKHVKSIVQIKQKTFNQYFAATANTVCPACGNKEFTTQKGNLLTKALNAANHTLGGKIAFWRYILLERI